MINKIREYLQRFGSAFWRMTGKTDSGFIRIIPHRFPGVVPLEIRKKGIPRRVENTTHYSTLSQFGRIKSYMFGKEILNGVEVRVSKTHDLSPILGLGKLTLPVCLPDYVPDGRARGETGKNFTIVLDGKKISSNILESGRWKYFTIPEGTQHLQVESNESDIVIGHPITHTSKNVMADKVKCVVLLVIDSLSQYIVRDHNTKTLMPNTETFFRQGRSFPHHYAQGEWSLPNMASIFTGLYSSHHGLHQRKLFVNYDNSEIHSSMTLNQSIPLLSEVYQSEGYLTFGCTGNWRVHPLYGYTRGYDRYLYYGNNCDDREIIYQTIEQMKAFPDRHQFLYLNLMKPHNTEPPFWSFESEVKFNTLSREIYKSDSKLRSQYSNSLVDRYSALVKDTDKDLKALYETLEEQYDPEDVLVVLTADHGVLYLDDDDHLLSETQVNVPLYVRSTRLDPAVDRSLVQNIDISKNMLVLSGLSPKDFASDSTLWPALGGEGRKFVLAESIYDEKYLLMIKDQEFVYRMECPISDNQVIYRPRSIEFYKISKTNKYETSQLENSGRAYEMFTSIGRDHIESLREKLARNSSG